MPHVADRIKPIRSHIYETAYLGPGQLSGFVFDIFTPLEDAVPRMFSFKVKLQSETEDGELKLIEVLLSWDVENDAWIYGTGPTAPANATRREVAAQN